MLFRAVSRFSKVLNPTTTLTSNGIRFAPRVSFTRSFAGKADPSSRIQKAVEDFVNTRRAELEQHTATDEADKEETAKLISSLKNAKIDRATAWASLGFDGLDEVEIVLAIEEAFGIRLTDDEFHSIRSVSDAIEVFSKYTANVG